MAQIRKLLRSPYSPLMGNVAARVAALASTLVATLLLARDGGPAVVGIYALLHVLPGLVGMIASSGLTVAIAYFMAGPDREDRRLPLTLVAMALAGGAGGAALWVVGAPLFGHLLFPDLSLGLVMLAGALVLTRLIVITAKSCSQGSEDLLGSNRVIFTEELMFLPAYGVLWAAGIHGYSAVVAGLLIADCATSSLAWGRLIRRGFFASAARPSLQLTRRVAAYGLRAQVGGLLSQLNLRLDFVLLNLITGPAVLGVYAIASKWAELIKILGMALTYVLYPQFAREGRDRAGVKARRLIPRAGLLTVGAAVPLWLAAGFVIPAFYGSAFGAAITPARIILLGLALEGVAGVITAYLYGVGRPGLNSWAMGAGLAATVVLDIVLIPPFGATGAAVASAVAYGTSTLSLIWLFRRLGRSERATGPGDSRLPRADAQESDRRGREGAAEDPRGHRSSRPDRRGALRTPAA
jgi:O-antigen/teichoic acid export membrane protein